MPKPNIAIVGWTGGVPSHLSPRGQRCEQYVLGLEPHADVVRIADEPAALTVRGSASRTSSSPVRRFLRRTVTAPFLDQFEMSSALSLGRWTPAVDGAILVGFPWSPIAYAARRLRRLGIPYIVDTGDPWALTNPDLGGPAIYRARALRAERAIYRGASAAILTTDLQAAALADHFPELPVLVRPNGFTPAAPVQRQPTGNDRDVLALVHYGSLYGPRADLAAVLRALIATGEWKRIHMTQRGSDWESSLDSLSSELELQRLPPIPLEDIPADAARFDAAVVIGHSDRSRLPSKAIQYLTLNMPKLAVATPYADDVLRQYVGGLGDWRVLDSSGDGVHGLRTWLEDAPAVPPPVTEAWPTVREELVSFVAESLQIAR